jgi:hypothetical protein
MVDLPDWIDRIETTGCIDRIASPDCIDRIETLGGKLNKVIDEGACAR